MSDEKRSHITVTAKRDPKKTAVERCKRAAPANGPKSRPSPAHESKDPLDVDQKILESAGPRLVLIELQSYARVPDLVFCDPGDDWPRQFPYQQRG
jgi:hypothetical protein